MRRYISEEEIYCALMELKQHDSSLDGNDVEDCLFYGPNGEIL